MIVEEYHVFCPKGCPNLLGIGENVTVPIPNFFLVSVRPIFSDFYSQWIFTFKYFLSRLYCIFHTNKLKISYVLQTETFKMLLDFVECVKKKSKITINSSQIALFELIFDFLSQIIILAASKTKIHSI